LRDLDSQVDELVGTFFDPIIVMPGGWGDTLPDWIKNQITLERLAQNIKTLKGEKLSATDAEACAYLYTASLEAPIDNDWTQIYLYVAGKVVSRAKDTKIPVDIRVDSLNDYQIGLLRDLKDWIYGQRLKVRRERQKMERAEVMAEAKARAPKQLNLGV
jgi:hypothetical protein